MTTDVDEQSLVKLLQSTNMNAFHQRDDPRLCDPELDNASLSDFVEHSGGPAGVVKVPAEICEHIRELHAETDVSYQQLAEDMGVAKSTVSHHVREKCKHERSGKTGDQCDAIRAAALDGVLHGDIAEMFSFVDDAGDVWKHANGDCSCDSELPAVGEGE